MINNDEDEVNMELIPITSHRIEEIAESSCASQKSRKRVRRKVKESPPCKILRHDALPEEIMFQEIRAEMHRGQMWLESVACIRGTPEENYQILPSYLHMMVAKNPGTYTSIKRDAQNRFAYLFFAPAASVAGWSYCRPVIAVDETFLKSKYHGVLFVTVSKDANNQIFPLCFGVADSENNEAYIWFFGEMRKAIQVRRELVFLSDRNQSIANGIRKVFPEAHHGICLCHFEKNLKQIHVKATVINLFQSAARSYKREDFNQLMSQLKSIDKKTYNYIMEEPPERWARSWFPRRRYDMLTTNMVESMNSVLLKG
ncbi:uncharacterized protein LOC142180752 [Nicotiana tabacum]|uniref:Uncharacterized protein LOC142180752 n=1 Tax=Nicotiana tabacum TaxID=4097 RepID=A0AC58UI57_TOBAC